MLVPEKTRSVTQRNSPWRRMVATTRKIAGYAVGLLALLVVRKPSRKQRRRALRNAIYASYDRAGNDPEFQAEMRALDEEFDATVGDGLDEETPGA